MSRKCIVKVIGYGDIDEFEITEDMMEEDVAAAAWEYGKEFLSTIIDWQIEEDDE